MSERLTLRGERIVLPDGERPATLHIANGRIAGIGEYDDGAVGIPVFEAGERVVSPGGVDTHVHINEPGRTDWEGFASATRAAAAGGVTTVVDMPLNSIPPTTTVDGLDVKRQSARGQCHVDVAFWGGVVPGNATELRPLALAGVRGFKCFLSPSGVDEFAAIDEPGLRIAMPILSQLGLPLLAHAELPSQLRSLRGDPRRYATWLDSRPPIAETAAIELLIGLSREFGTRIHVVHLATGDAVTAIRAARDGGVPITVETCPHYLTFAAEDIGDGRTELKCAPPIRGRAERDRLWQALVDADIDLIATDHSPAPPAIKHLEDGDFVTAWGGIASLQIGLPAVWTAAAARGVPLTAVAGWLAEGPARLAGLYPRKGVIAAGADADLVVWDPTARIMVDACTLYHRHPVTPYHGRELRGRVHTTFLRGTIIYDDGSCCGGPVGQLI
jgi:allantoinase